MKGCIGFLIMLIGGSGFDSNGNGWYIAAVLVCLGIGLMATETKNT